MQMKTFISYDSDVEKDAKIIKRIPQGSFECPKMNPGDMMDFDVVQRSGDHILTPVKVTHVSISISWNGFKESKGIRKIQDAEQFVYVTPDIFNNEEINQNIEPRKRRRSNFGG
jgi:hypothetical protein